MLAYSARVNPDVISGYGAGVGAGTVVTGKATCTVSAGTPPYTYHWVIAAGDPEIKATSSTSPETTFYASTPPFIFSYSATVYCEVTDSLANVINSNLITVTIERNT